MREHNPFIQNRHGKSEAVTHLLVIVSMLLAVFAFTLPMLTTFIVRAG